jgi:TonB family protein
MLNENRYYIFSILLHAMLLALFLPYAFSQQESKPGDSDHNAIDAYVYPDIEKHTSSHATVINSATGIAISKKTLAKNIHPATHTESHAASKGEQVKGLLGLLHQSVQKHLQYPESAQELGREGRATIAFTLFRDGHVEHVVVSKSSGTELLDSAAISAVLSAAPFVEIAQHVRKAGEYRVDVIFKLG